MAAAAADDSSEHHTREHHEMSEMAVVSRFCTFTLEMALGTFPVHHYVYVFVCHLDVAWLQSQFTDEREKIRGNVLSLGRMAGRLLAGTLPVMAKSRKPLDDDDDRIAGSGRDEPGSYGG